MHQNSLRLMIGLLEKHAAEIPAGSICYDIGSLNVNGNYRKLVEDRGLKYVGVDIEAGDNVDIVVNKDSWGLPELHDAAPLVISGQCMEHVERPWLWIKNVASALEADGILLLIAPASWPEHKYPIDCWRFLPQGMEVLAHEAGLTLVDAGLSNGGQDDSRGEDCWAVMKKA